MEKVLDAILARPDTTLSVLLLLMVIGGLLYVIRHQSTANKEAMASISASLQQMASVITELRIDAASKGRR